MKQESTQSAILYVILGMFILATITTVRAQNSKEFNK